MAVTPDQLSSPNPYLEGTAERLRIRDRFGITYDSGHASHVMLTALRHRHVLGAMPLTSAGRTAVYAAAGHATTWLSCLHTPDEHRRRLAALTPERVCRMVARLATVLIRGGFDENFKKVGPATLPLYSGYVLALADADSDDELPPTPWEVESPPAWLGENQPLDITVTGPHGADTVVMHVEVEAFQNLFWSLATTLPFPVSEARRFLCGDSNPRIYLTENPDLLKDYLRPDKVSETGAPELYVHLPDPPSRALECRCVKDCDNDPDTACSLSGEFHVHPDDGTGLFGPCPEHPDAPGDR